MNAAALLLCSCAALLGSRAPEKRPNIVVLLADDLGWGDLGVHGGAVPTPSIDALFESGVEFRRFLVAPRCSPTRAALLTGRHPMRVGLGPGTVRVDTAVHLPAAEVTLAEMLGDAGYTSAFLGKWHLGRTVGPREQGFDHFYGCFGPTVDALEQTRPHDGVRDWWVDGDPSVDRGEVSALLADAACTYLERERQNPFLLFVSFTAVHWPLRATPPALERFAKIEDPEERAYAAMLSELDTAIGRILAQLDASEHARDTIVFFASDNGAIAPGSNGPYRAGKATPYEGGVRVPAAVRWVGTLPAGSAVEGLVAVEDLVPTALGLAGIERDPDVLLDGIDASRALRGDPAPRSSYAWVEKASDAFTTERWKLVRYASRVELFDLAADPGEHREIASANAEVVAALTEQLDTWEANLPVYPPHVPIVAAADAIATPADQVLEIRAHLDDAAEPQYIYLTGFERTPVHPSDYFEFDLFVEPSSARRGFRFDVTTDVTKVRYVVPSVDQFGRLWSGRAALPKAVGQWSRRAVGLAHLSPNSLGRLRLSLLSAGDYLLRVDNPALRRSDGSRVELRWAEPVVTAEGAEGSNVVETRLIDLPAPDSRGG